MWAEGSQTPPGPALQALSRVLVYLNSPWKLRLSRGEASALEASAVLEPFCQRALSAGVAAAEALF